MSGLLCPKMRPWTIGSDWDLGHQHLMELELMAEGVNVVEDELHLLNNFVLNQP